MNETFNSEAIEFLAFCAYINEYRGTDTIPCRWGVLSEEVKARSLEKARETISRWKKDEEDARLRRENNDPLAFFCGGKV